MNLSVGIVGLPNVGKSTLFNALLKKQSSFAEASAGQAGSGGARVGNYPFTTIEPNVGVVAVPDKRLDVLADIIERDSSPAQRDQNDRGKRPPIVPATVKFVDIAGLVKGANEGAGLGNKFLSHIREVSIIAHVVRAFSDENVIKEGSVDPLSDYKTIETELLLADLQTIENSKLKSQKSKLQLKNPSFAKASAGKQNETIEKITNALDHEIPVRDIQFTDEEREEVKQFFLLTAKPEIVVLNVSETDYTKEQIPKIAAKYAQELKIPLGKIVVISAKIEAELSELSEGEQKQYLKELGFSSSGLERLIQKAYQTLDLISFLTAGEKEVRAWTVRAGSTALAASGEIHTDFMKKFIKAEVVSYEDFVSVEGWKKARELGKARLEGKDYIVQDGDVIEFKIGS